MRAIFPQINGAAIEHQIGEEGITQTQQVIEDSANIATHRVTILSSLRVDTTRTKAVPILYPTAEINKKEGFKQIISNVDSLRLNLTGNKESYTDWDFSLEYNPQAFDRTLFSQIDYGVLRQKSDNTDTISTSDEIQIVNEGNGFADQQDTKTIRLQDQDDAIVFNQQELKSNFLLLSLLLTAVFIAGVVRLNWRQYLTTIFRSVLYPASERKIAETNISNTFPSFAMNLLFFFNSSLFAYEIFKMKNLVLFDSNMPLFPAIFIIIFVVFSLKNMLFVFIGHIFSISTQIKVYIKSFTISKQMFAIVIIPIICVIPFMTPLLQDVMIKIGIFAFILLYLITIGKGLKIIFRESFSIYYIFLYLCALEFVPLLLIIKLISTRII